MSKSALHGQSLVLPPNGWSVHQGTQLSQGPTPEQPQAAPRTTKRPRQATSLSDKPPLGNLARLSHSNARLNALRSHNVVDLSSMRTTVWSFHSFCSASKECFCGSHHRSTLGTLTLKEQRGSLGARRSLPWEATQRQVRQDDTRAAGDGPSSFLFFTPPPEPELAREPPAAWRPGKCRNRDREHTCTSGKCMLALLSSALPYSHYRLGGTA